MDKRNTRIHSISKNEYLDYKRSTNWVIPKEKFQLIVKKVFLELNSDLGIQTKALELLQFSAEALIIEMFTETNLSVTHSQRVQFTPKDIQIARRIRGKH
jgi:histone H3/H4